MDLLSRHALAVQITTSDHAGKNAHGPAGCAKTPRQALERRPNRCAALLCGGRWNPCRITPASTTCSGRTRQRTGGTHLGREMNASGCQDVTLEARPLGPPHAAAAGPYPDLACLRACLSGRPRGAGPHAGAVILQQARPMRCIAGSGADVPPAHLQGLQGRIGLASPRRRVRTAPPAWRRNACANSNQPDHVRLGSMRGIASWLRPPLMPTHATNKSRPLKLKHSARA